jgi:hypothetical protein
MNKFLKSIPAEDKEVLIKSSFKSLQKNPLVSLLLKNNIKLEKENKKLRETIINICRTFTEKNNENSTKSVNIINISETKIKVEKVDSNPVIVEDDDEVVILEKVKETNENIVFTIDEDEVVEKEEEEEEDVVVEEEDEEVVVEEEDEEEEEEEEVVVEEEDEDVVVEEEEEEEEEEEVVVDEEEEEVVVEEEEVQEEEVVVEEEEEEEEVVEEEEEEEPEQEESDDEVYEIQIKGKTYYVTNEINSIIYEADKDGDISIEAGVYKNGKPCFNKK